jgi:hypothetical protein
LICKASSSRKRAGPFETAMGRCGNRTSFAVSAARR